MHIIQSSVTTYCEFHSKTCLCVGYFNIKKCTATLRMLTNKMAIDAN